MIWLGMLPLSLSDYWSDLIRSWIIRVIMDNQVFESTAERTFQYQSSLPPLPVPDLQNTLNKYLHSGERSFNTWILLAIIFMHMRIGALSNYFISLVTFVTKYTLKFEVSKRVVNVFYTKMLTINGSADLHWFHANILNSKYRQDQSCWISICPLKDDVCVSVVVVN